MAELLEMVGEYMNDHEMIEAVDLAINTPIYDLVYERKTDDDFEILEGSFTGERLIM